MNPEFSLKVNQFLAGKKDKFFQKDSQEILRNLEFIFMKEIHEYQVSPESIQNILNIIDNEKYKRKLKNVTFFTILNFKNMVLKRQNMRIFYYQNEEGTFELYLSFNLNDRKFSNRKYHNLSKKEMDIIILGYKMKEIKLKKAS